MYDVQRAALFQQLLYYNRHRSVIDGMFLMMAFFNWLAKFSGCPPICPFTL
jgi:hypothetical protein